MPAVLRTLHATNYSQLSRRQTLNPLQVERAELRPGTVDGLLRDEGGPLISSR